MPAPEFELHRAAEEQAATIRRLVVSSGINPIGLDWRRFVVAENGDGEVIGCGQLKPHRDGSLELASIAVQENWRRQGVATAVIERLIRDHDGDLYLLCRSNLGTFYEKFGFEVISGKQMPPYFRFISKLANFFSSLVGRESSLLVMHRTKDSSLRSGAQNQHVR